MAQAHRQKAGVLGEQMGSSSTCSGLIGFRYTEISLQLAVQGPLRDCFRASVSSSGAARLIAQPTASTAGFSTDL
jgi:hypothetical protein